MAVLKNPDVVSTIRTLPERVGVYLVRQIQNPLVYQKGARESG